MFALSGAALSMIRRTATAMLALTVLILADGAIAADTALPANTTAAVRQTWKMLDYLAADYAGAVTNGEVSSPSEFAEMQEFAARADESLAGLPPRPEQAELLKQGEDLKAAIAAHHPVPEVAKRAHGLATALLAAYPIPMAPAAAPNLSRGATIFSQKCVVCHGLQGNGDGPAAAKLNPPPIAFTNHDRARERSIHSLYEVVSQGVADTPMVSFQAALSDVDRWDVAFRVGNFAFTDAERAEGEKLWQSDPSLHTRIPNLDTLTGLNEAGLAADIGEDKAGPVLAYLRAHPDILAPAGGSGLALVRSQLAASLTAYHAGDAQNAAARALSAYLDGFEPIEAALQARDSALLAKVETAMAELRTRIGQHADVPQVEAQVQTITGLLDQVEATLAGAGDATTTFLGAFTILVREGIEAMLVVVAMLSFLAKVERRDVLVYVHAGWISALVAGALTWAAAAFLMNIRGADRELTEGFSSLFAAMVLLGVGVWMHQKSLAGRWQVYLKEKLSAALTRKSAFFLFALAFVAVYREVFETILFYIALWTRGNGTSILAGLVAGAAVLVAIAAVLMRTGRRLPISQFFAWSSALIALLAFVLAGKGVAALQEAGVLPAAAINGPRVDLLGIYPSALTLSAQGLVAAIVVVGYWWNTRLAPGETKAG